MKRRREYHGPPARCRVAVRTLSRLEFLKNENTGAVAAAIALR